MKRAVVAGTFQRPLDGPVWNDDADTFGLAASGLPAWQGNGGPTRGHPARALPFRLDVLVPEVEGELRCVHLLGVFALWASAAHEAMGAIGGSVQLEGVSSSFHFNLVCGRHYEDALTTPLVERTLGDGSSIRSVGSVDLRWGTARVDHLAIEIPRGSTGHTLRFRDLGTSASFVLFDVLFEFEVRPVCPFHTQSGGVSLAELASVVRVGDRVRFRRAIAQLRGGITSEEDPNEAKGEALTFISVVCSALLEMGAPRRLHSFQLEAAREIDRLTTLEEVASRAEELLRRLVGPLMSAGPSTGDPLVDRALELLERRFAQSVDDRSIADELGISTSHFRHLFRQATGQPFSKFLFSLRLEKAREMLMSLDVSVSEIARLSGFTSAAHFSRAFGSRFGVSPSILRKDASHGHEDARLVASIDLEAARRRNG